MKITRIVATQSSRWELQADGKLYLIGTAGRLPFPIIGAYRRRPLWLRPIVYTPADLYRIGHTLAWRDDGRQLIKIVHQWGESATPWNFPHWMEIER